MKNIKVRKNITIREAMKALEKTAEKCLLTVNRDNKLLGTITDGDIRRSILSGAKFSDDISSSYNSNPTVLIKNMFNKEKAERLLLELKLDLIPILDKNKRVVDYITWSTLGTEKNIIEKTLEKVPVVIMSGGKGTRMEPFTKVLPKPLVPIREKPIIEHIIERFTKINCNTFYITINYKGTILKAYFDELNPKYNINFVKEKKPLGTAGSLRLLDGEINQPFFLTNCDIIIKADYNKLYKFHVNGNYDITLVASSKEYIIPYGTCKLNKDGHLSHIDEKPKYDFLINTGLYLLNPDILKLIPKNKFFHITNLIKTVKDKGKKVGVFPIDDDNWIDVGQWKEYKNALDSF